MHNTRRHRGKTFWALQIPGWVLLAYLVYAQGVTAIDYELGVAMGTQESAETITAVGAAFWYGFAFGDLFVYIPLLLLGLIGHCRDKRWGRTGLAAALGITVYWPIVCLAAMVTARGADGWNISAEAPYWTICTAISVWGAWGLTVLLKQSQPDAARQDLN